VYPDQETALAALQRGEIQAFFVIPSTYPATLNTELYTSQGTLGSAAWGDFDKFVRESLVAGLAVDTQQRLLNGPSITVHDISNGREFNEDAIINIILPIAGGLFFMFAISMASGYMVQIVTDEKESRTMEVLLTSLTPAQLLGGKSLGLLAAALTQLFVYILAAVVGLMIAANYVPELRQATVPWGARCGYIHRDWQRGDRGPAGPAAFWAGRYDLLAAPLPRADDL
jgi:ABC-2 type transport system permease protein